MDTRNLHAVALLSRPRHGQRGMVTVAAVILMIVAVMLALSQTISMTATNATDTNLQNDSVTALLAAESGIERAIGILNAQVITGTITNTTCTSTVGPAGTSFAFPTGSATGSFTYTTLTSVPATCSGVTCTACTIQIVGKSGNASRTIDVSVRTTGASGGAAGCGGGGVAIHVAGCEDNIDQYITATTVPQILMSNLSFRRHPGGGVNISAAGCVAIDGLGVSSTCITQWSDKSSSGNPAVGSRGASVMITAVGSYTLRQNLDNNSNYAASGGRIGRAAGKTLSIVGSYWAESGAQTVSNSSATTGATNNGAAYTASPPGPAAITPAIGTNQASQSWCYGGDTLVFGFSGKSSNGANGALNTFRFGNAPVDRGVAVSNAFIQYPTPSAGVNSDVYSNMFYIYNPDYMSGAGAAVSSGVNITGTIGTTATASAQASGSAVIGAAFNGTIAKNSTTLTVTGANNTIRVNDVISCGGGCGVNGATVTAVGVGSVTVNPQASKAESNSAMTARSTTITLSGVTVRFATGAINGTGVTAGTTITVGAGAGGNGNYTVNQAQYVPPSTAVTGSTYTLTLSSPPVSGTFTSGDFLSGSGSPNFAAIGFPLACTDGTVPTGTGGNAGTYCLSIAQNFTSTTVTAPSTRLTVTAIPLAFDTLGGLISGGDSISGTGITATTIGSQVSGTAGGKGIYTVANSQYVASTFNMALSFSGGGSGTVIKVTPGTTMPVLNPSYPMLVTRRTFDRASSTTVGSGGEFPVGTTVTSLLNANSFIVNNAPSSPLNGVTVCGGTCALFDHSSATSTTSFSLGLTNTAQWAAGMTCFAGADPNSIIGLTGTGASTGTTSWHAPVF